MACATAWERRERVAYAPVWGIALSYVFFVLFASGIWFEIENEDFARATMSIGTVGLVAAHASLLRRVPLRRRAEVTALLAIGGAVALAALVIVLLWRDEEPVEAVVRLLGVLAVLVASTTIATPIIHLLAPRVPGAVEAHRVLNAPGRAARSQGRCGGGQAQAAAAQ
jgi:hypothetical protein